MDFQASVYFQWFEFEDLNRRGQLDCMESENSNKGYCLNNQSKR
jgi:hypothetical protein